LFWTR